MNQTTDEQTITTGVETMKVDEEKVDVRIDDTEHHSSIPKSILLAESDHFRAMFQGPRKVRILEGYHSLPSHI